MVLDQKRESLELPEFILLLSKFFQMAFWFKAWDKVCGEHKLKTFFMFCSMTKKMPVNTPCLNDKVLVCLKKGTWQQVAKWDYRVCWKH